MALINKPNYSLLQFSSIFKTYSAKRNNWKCLHHIQWEYEVIEAEIIETSELISKEIKNSNLPEELRIGAILREKKVIIPRSDFIFKKDDRVVFIVKKDSISIVENIFRLSSI